MKKLKKIFTPLETVDKSTMRKIGAAQLVAFLLAWTFLVPQHSLIPNLGEVLRALSNYWGNGLFFQIIATLFLCSMATLVSIFFSSLMAYASTIPFFKPPVSLLGTLRYNPIQGFTVILTVMTGGGRWLQILILSIFMSFYFITGLVSIINDIPEGSFNRVRAMRMNGWKILWKVVIVDHLDFLIEVIRLNLSMTFMMIVSVEAMDKSQGGLGAMLTDTSRGMNFPNVFAIQAVILLLGLVIDWALRLLFNSFPAHKKNC